MKLMKLKKYHQKTKAVIATHTYGYPIEIDKIKKICKKYKLILIEDAAEMLGHKYRGKPCGSFGDLSIFIFILTNILLLGRWYAPSNNQNINIKYLIIKIYILEKNRSIITI